LLAGGSAIGYNQLAEPSHESPHLVNMIKSIHVVLAIGLFASRAPAASVFSFNLNDQPPAPFSSSNVLLASAGTQTFYQPKQPLIEGQVIYKFTLPPNELAQSGTLLAKFNALTSSQESPTQFDRDAYVYLDASRNGFTWTNINAALFGHSDTSNVTRDSTGSIKMSHDVFIRARLYAPTTPAAARFLISTAGDHSPSLVVNVTTIPEPATSCLSLIAALAICGCKWPTKKPRVAGVEARRARRC